MKKIICFFLMIVLVFSNIMTAFAVTVSPTSYSALNNIISQFDKGNGNYLLPLDISSFDSKQAELFHSLLDKQDNPSQYGIVFFLRPSSYTTGFIYLSSSGQKKQNCSGCYL